LGAMAGANAGISPLRCASVEMTGFGLWWPGWWIECNGRGQCGDLSAALRFGRDDGVRIVVAGVVD
jgi:hypothetical protein